MTKTGKQVGAPAANAQVAAFLERHTDALAIPSVGHLRPGTVVVDREFNDNESGGYDGFFYARFDKALP